MNKHENLDNDQKELVRYWLEKYETGCNMTKEDFMFAYLTPTPVIEAGKCYTVGDSFMIFSESFNKCKGTIIGYGFDFCGRWQDEMSYKFSSSDTIKEAAPEEVETRLIEEAKRTGYVEGAKVKCLLNGDISEIKGTFFFNENNELFSHRKSAEYIGECIMSNGKWAEIIDPKAEIRESVARLEAELQTFKSQL